MARIMFVAKNECKIRAVRAGLEETTTACDACRENLKAKAKDQNKLSQKRQCTH